ncbi:MAG TPA: saccharopine dehydrogenase NADP-binding domain-containing protein [Terriglobia bacterium]|jgi:short subunit dehydrogenase-like uncharacterized protein
MSTLAIYGATGYSGQLIVRRALARGLRPLIAGRDRQAVEFMASSNDLEWKIARVDEPASLRAMTASAPVLLNAAGPFSTTASALIDACLSTGTHYLDITGEPEVIEQAAAHDDTAARRGVMLMPAVGFEVVASDCLAAHVARRLPGATALKLGFHKSQPSSRGSLKTCIGMNGQGVLVRRRGILARVAAGSLVHQFDYGQGPQMSLAVSLADVSSAYFSTGIPDVETYLCATLPIWSAITANQYWGWLISTPAIQGLIKAQLDWLAPDPSPPERNQGWGALVVEAFDGCGGSARSRLQTGDVYWFTALSAVAIAERCLAGELKPGFHTPSRIYGPDFALSFDGAMREDL